MITAQDLQTAASIERYLIGRGFIVEIIEDGDVFQVLFKRPVYLFAA